MDNKRGNITATGLWVADMPWTCYNQYRFIETVNKLRIIERILPGQEKEHVFRGELSSSLPKAVL